MVLPAKIKTKIQRYLQTLSKTYYEQIPLQAIISHLKEQGLQLVEAEHPTEKLNCIFLCGENSGCQFMIADEAFNFMQRYLVLRWYRMPSGKYEINVYVS